MELTDSCCLVTSQPPTITVQCIPHVFGVIRCKQAYCAATPIRVQQSKTRKKRDDNTHFAALGQTDKPGLEGTPSQVGLGDYKQPKAKKIKKVQHMQAWAAHNTWQW